MYREATFAEKYAMVFYHYAVLATVGRVELAEVIYVENEMRRDNILDENAYRELVEMSSSVHEEFLALCKSRDKAKPYHD